MQCFFLFFIIIYCCRDFVSLSFVAAIHLSVENQPLKFNRYKRFQCISFFFIFLSLSAYLLCSNREIWICFSHVFFPLFFMWSSWKFYCHAINSLKSYIVARLIYFRNRFGFFIFIFNIIMPLIYFMNIFCFIVFFLLNQRNESFLGIVATNSLSGCYFHNLNN